MQTLLAKIPPCLVFSLALAAGAAVAEPYAVGERIEPFTLEDQFGTERKLDGEVEMILFSRDMDGGDLLKEALADVPGNFLAGRNAVYVSDISGMPGLVARLFALPSMRRRGYPMWLDRDGATTARLPDEAGRATLVFCRDLEITRIEHAASANDVRRQLGLPVSGGEATE